jgi:hypothetical protein
LRKEFVSDLIERLECYRSYAEYTEERSARFPGNHVEQFRGATGRAVRNSGNRAVVVIKHYNVHKHVRGRSCPGLRRFAFALHTRRCLKAMQSDVLVSPVGRRIRRVAARLLDVREEHEGWGEVTWTVRYAKTGVNIRWEILISWSIPSMQQPYNWRDCRYCVFCRTDQPHRVSFQA